MDLQTKNAVAKYLRGEILRTRNNLNISQAKMADLLGISTRGYRSLEAGESCCALLTVLLFWRNCCLDKEKFLTGLASIVDAGVMDELFD